MGRQPRPLWDVFAEQGHPVRATISDMGPLLLARLMNLAPATVSHHLAGLAEAGLTTVRQDGHHRLHGVNHAALGATLSALIWGEAAAPAAMTGGSEVVKMKPGA